LVNLSKADTKKSPLPESMTAAVMPKMEVRAGQIESGSFSVSADLTMPPPVSTQRMMGTMMGEVPSNILSSGSFKIPHSTDVGQSGPPTSTDI